MQRVAIDDVDPAPERSTRRELAAPLGATNVAVNHYTLEPGAVFSGSLHAHDDQEEVFVVLAGTTTFQLEDRTIEVGPREAVRFAPGEFQRGYNAGDEPVVALALGAPSSRHDEAAITALVDCAGCGERMAHDVALVDDAFVRSCRTCGTVNEPGPPPGLSG